MLQKREIGRLAVIGLAIDAGASKRGANLGPYALRMAGLLQRLSDLGHHVEDWGDLGPEAWRAGLTPGPLPPAPTRDVQVLALAPEASAAGLAAMRAGLKPVFLGGDHSLSMGSIAGVARACAASQKPLHVLWLDAHADFNTPLTSPSGNMHGMSLAMLCGEPEFAAMTGGEWFAPVDPRHVTIFGARSIDREERALLAARGLDVIDMRLIDEFGVSALMRRVIERAGAAKAHLHVSFDTDVLDPTIAPGTGTPVPGGLNYREAHLVMEMLHDSGLVGSVDIVELNPLLDERGVTAEVVVAMTASLFGQQILDRSMTGPR
jgi:arginase